MNTAEIVPPPNNDGNPSGAVVTVKPPRKPRKKATAPVKERKPRLVPARTLRVRVAELGPTHLDAMDLLAKKDDWIPTRVREALDAEDEVKRAITAASAAEDALSDANDAVDRAVDALGTLQPVLARLDAVAKSLATALGEMPDEPTDEDRKGVDTARAESDENL